MEFKVLAVGDVVGNPGLDRVRRHLRQLKRKTGAHFAVVNGENAAEEYVWNCHTQGDADDG